MKFAYLIVAHHRFDVLMMLLKDLDDRRNDIFLHIDKKTKNVDYLQLKDCVKSANLVFVRRIKVYWSDYSQIQCVYNLLNEAVKYGYHDYYHYIAGVEFPIKSQDYIHSFFESNNGKEFVGYFLGNTNYLDRIQYFHFFRKYARNNDEAKHRLYLKGKCFVSLQKSMGVSRIKRGGNYYKKGNATWSITHNLAQLFISEIPKKRKYYRFSAYGDEIIFHTILYNSEYKKNIFDYENEFHSAMRLTTWEDPKNQLHMKDLDTILKSEKIFGKKFDTEDATEIISKILQYRQ